MSLPSRERGLKFAMVILFTADFAVAPFAGAWIEIYGVNTIRKYLASLLSRECGLKLDDHGGAALPAGVAPITGAWV